MPKNSAVPERRRMVRVPEKETSKRYSVLAERSWVRVIADCVAWTGCGGAEVRLSPGRDIMMADACVEHEKSGKR